MIVRDRKGFLFFFQSNRITVEDSGCQLILTHVKCREILNQLLDALDSNDASRSTNIAFAIARLIEEEIGKKTLVNACGEKKFVKYPKKKNCPYSFLSYSVYSSINNVEDQ